MPNLSRWAHKQASRGGEFTWALNWDATAADVQAALNALTSINSTGSVSAVGGPLNAAPFTISFTSVPGADTTLLGVATRICSNAEP